MKKYLILALVLMPFAAFAQGNLTSNTGATFSLLVGFLNTDSVYTIGTVDMVDVDSIQIQGSVTDSAHIAPLVEVITTHKTTDTATASVTAVVGGAVQLTAAGIFTVPWHNIVAAIKPNHLGIKSLRIKARLVVVGTETYATAGADKQTWFVKKFKSR